MTAVLGWIAAHVRLCAALALIVAASLTRPGRWTWRRWWWPLLCAAGRAMLPDAQRRTDGRLDRRRFFTDDEKRRALRRDGDRCQCATGSRSSGGCGNDMHRHHGQCEVRHLDGQRLVGGHVEAHARGGRTNLANLAMVCAACNTAYRDRPMVIVARRRGWRRLLRLSPPQPLKETTYP